MIEAGKLCELDGKATKPTAPINFSSGSWSMPVATNSINITSNSSTGNSHNSY